MADNTTAAADSRRQLTDIDIRAYSDADEAATLDLLAASLGAGPAGGRTSEFFRWKHYDNPFGRSFMLVAETGGRIVGFRSLMRWRFQTEGVPVAAVRAVDTATHPEWQGRGLFRRLTLEAVERLRADTDFIFNTPNHKSRPGYLKMGWRVVDKVSIGIKVRRPLRFARGVRTLNSSLEPDSPRPKIHAHPASEMLNLEGVGDLVAEARPLGRRLATAVDLPYLRWRYGSAPGLDYRAVVSERAGSVCGIAIFRVRARGPLWEATVSELIAAPGDTPTCSRLLREVADSAPVDHIACHFPVKSMQASAARRRGFMPAPGGVTFVVNRLRDVLAVDPGEPGSWALSLGDVEVF